MADEVARLVAVVEANIKSFTKGMDQAQKVADRRFGQIESRLKKTESVFARSFKGIGSAVVGGAALFGIQRFVRSVADMAGNLQDTSDALGVSTDALQTWGILAGRAGVKQEQFNKALGQFASRLGEAQIKGGDFAKFLTGIGVGTQGTTEEVFNRVADAVKNTADQQQRAAIVAEAFGARAVRLTSVIQQGSAALKAQGLEFAKNGQIMTREAISKIDELGDKWEDLKRQFLTIGANSLGPLVDELSSPAFQQGLQAFAKGMSEVAIAIARMAPHLPLLLAVMTGSRIAGAAGAGIGGVIGLSIEAWRRQTGQIQDGIAKLEKDLANAEARAARREPGAADQAAGIRAQINRQKAQAAGIPFAGAGDPAATTGGIDRSGSLAKDDENEAKKKAEIAAGILEHYAGVRQHFLDQETKAVEEAAQIEADIRQHYSDVQQELWAREADELADFHERANAAWDSYYERQAEAADSAYNERLAQADTFFGSLATLTRSSSEELRNIGKAAAIIQATIDGVLAVQKALASAPPPINFALAAAVGAAAAVNVAEIAAMEKGGRVQAGTPYIVGEKRPELFVPDTAGTIIPRVPNIADPKMGMSGINMTFTNHNAFAGAVDANSIRAYAEQVGAVSSQAAIRNIERRFPRLMVKAQRDHL